jgi:hypothetical protein
MAVTPGHSGRQVDWESAALRPVLRAGLAAPEAIDLTNEGARFLELIERERLWGLAEVASEEGAIVLDAGTRRLLQAANRRAAITSLAIEQMVAKLDVAFGDEGVEWRLLKGCATAHVLYPRPEQRNFGDLDVLVRADDFQRAVGVLHSLSIDERSWAAPGSAHRRFGHALTLVSCTGLEVDLHRRVQALDRGSALSEALLFRRPQRVAIGGREVCAPAKEVMLIHSALHLASRETRASTMADLVRLIADPTLAFESSLRAAHDENALGYVHWAIAQASRIAPPAEACSEALRAIPASRFDIARVRYVQTHPTAAMLLDMAREPRRTRLLTELIWPTDEFLDSVRRSRSAHLTHLASTPLSFIRPRASRAAAMRRW